MHVISSKDSTLNVPTNIDEVTENYWRILDVNLAWIRQSDTKAYTIFMIYGISISLVFSNVEMIAAMVKNSYIVLILSVLYLVASLVAREALALEESTNTSLSLSLSFSLSLSLYIFYIYIYINIYIYV